jgi:hypothetical protein
LSGSQINAQFYSGIFRPIIGAAFALLVFFVLKSGIVNAALAASSDPAVTTSFFFAVSFLAGFSERLAPLIVTRTEEMFAPRSDETA